MTNEMIVPRSAFDKLARSPVSPGFNTAIPLTYRPDDVAESPVANFVRERVQIAMIARVKKWERDTLEAAFDAGLDIRTPWGPEIAAFATMTWRLWMTSEPL